jgi:hypothetical protein
VVFGINVTTRFIKELVSLAKSYSADVDEAATPEGGGSFAVWAMISLHSLRISLDKSYMITIDLLETMTKILDVMSIEPDDLPCPPTFNKWNDKIGVHVWRVLLCHSAQLHDPSPHAAVDAIYYECSPASKYYCGRTNYRVHTIEAMKLVDTDTQAILNVHCTTTREGSDAESLRNSPDATRASYTHLPTTRATTVSPYARHSVTWGYTHWSNIASLHPTMYTTSVLTTTATTSAP